ncbi:DNA/RNA helicase, DEAD/DEAH box type, N-terminal [Cynara cardunculus var. scolymus]|uniref:DNA/RNA helicase, DEAD/DEAH box type, N-terminal n=1 Tax=Cynara cardunculus var. scolymus TaxID=59895 RepID=A0A103XI08_CYNCS|nr:DNA/RNA helicase, DEAD/DEAH box type, N-terminal [Cynara cardunculus var. scolymus]
MALQTSRVLQRTWKTRDIQIMVSDTRIRLNDDIMSLYQRDHLLVGTLGRILDLARKGIYILKDCAMLVMDELKTVLYQRIPLQLIHDKHYTIFHQIKIQPQQKSNTYTNIYERVLVQNSCDGSSNITSLQRTWKTQKHGRINLKDDIMRLYQSIHSLVDIPRRI